MAKWFDHLRRRSVPGARFAGDVAPIGFDQRDRARLHELWNRILDEERWSEGELTQHFEPPALVEILFVVGQYTMLSMVANASGIEVPDGLEHLPGEVGR